MCIDCWNEAGQPANWTLEIKRALGLVRELYDIHAVGGPLHACLDDCNIDGEIRPYYDCYTPAELDELWDGRSRIADLDPQAPAVVDGLGRSMRQICDEIAALMNPMTLDDRMSVLAYHWKLASEPGNPHGALFHDMARHCAISDQDGSPE